MCGLFASRGQNIGLLRIGHDLAAEQEQQQQYNTKVQFSRSVMSDSLLYGRNQHNIVKVKTTTDLSQIKPVFHSKLLVTPHFARSLQNPQL